MRAVQKSVRCLYEYCCTTWKRTTLTEAIKYIETILHPRHNFKHRPTFSTVYLSRTLGRTTDVMSTNIDHTTPNTTFCSGSRIMQVQKGTPISIQGMRLISSCLESNSGSLAHIQSTTPTALSQHPMRIRN